MAVPRAYAVRDAGERGESERRVGGGESVLREDAEARRHPQHGDPPRAHAEHAVHRPLRPLHAGGPRSERSLQTLDKACDS
eukprot:1196217-Prorocentrum_minimum.AAC.2